MCNKAAQENIEALLGRLVVGAPEVVALARNCGSMVGNQKGV